MYMLLLNYQSSLWFSLHCITLITVMNETVLLLLSRLLETHQAVIALNYGQLIRGQLRRRALI